MVTSRGAGTSYDIDVNIDDSGVDKGLSNVENKAGKASRRIGDRAKKGLAIGGAVAAGVGTIVLGAVNMLDEVTELQGIVATGTGLVGEELQEMTADILAASESVNLSRQEIAGIGAQLNTELGLSGEALTDATTQVAAYVKATGEDATKATRLLTASLKFFDEEGANTETRMDEILKATQLVDTDFNKVWKTLQASGPVLDAMGMSFAESTALIANLQAEGLKSQDVINGLEFAFLRLTDVNGDYGLSAEEANAEIDRLTEGMADGTLSAEDAALAQKLFGTEIETVRKAAQSGALDVDELSSKISDSAGAVTEAELANRKFSDILATTFNTVKNDLLPILQGFLNWFNNSNPIVQKAVIIAGALVVALPLIGLAITPLIPLLFAMSGAGITLSASFLPIIAIVLAVIAVVALLVFAFIKFRPQIQQVWDAIVAAFQTGVNFILQYVNLYIKAVNAIISGVNAIIRQANRIPGVNFGEIGTVTEIGLLEVRGTTPSFGPRPDQQTSTDTSIADTIASRASGLTSAFSGLGAGIPTDFGGGAGGVQVTNNFNGNAYGVNDIEQGVRRSVQGGNNRGLAGAGANQYSTAYRGSGF